MKKLRFAFPLVLIIMLVFLGSGCTLVKPLELKKVNDFKINEKKGGGARLHANLTLHNPNSFGYTINTLDIDVFINDVELGKLIVPEKLEIEAKQNITGDFYIDVGFPRVLILGTTVLPKLKKGDVEVHLKGHANTSIWFFTKDVGIDKVEKVRFK